MSIIGAIIFAVIIGREIFRYLRRRYWHNPEGDPFVKSFYEEYAVAGLKRYRNESCELSEKKIFEIIERHNIYDQETGEIYNEKYYRVKLLINWETGGDIWWWTYILGHTIPTKDALSQIISTVDVKNCRALSVGSGMGLWEYLLEKNGWGVISSDIAIYDIMFKRSEIIGGSDVFLELIRRNIIRAVGDIDVLIVIWSQPDTDEEDQWIEDEGYDERALERFEGKYVVFVCEEVDHPTVGSGNFKKQLSDDFKVIRSIKLPFCMEYVPVVNIFERITF
ncbi:MAG: hypothetical protein Hyperionvirus4_128 [Hyperionvirus sp.]|uniref:Methyltransferase n=1 Tax=Hyperionvirus sp. TaxID=2487770 RepID=A0A3G5ABC0_9VIRU|nr:MAG: hypothetical protein Hyperionvirus4_128 [Hyperionvirus sp.]